MEVTQFSVPTISVAVSVIQRNVLCNTSELTAPGSFNALGQCAKGRGGSLACCWTELSTSSRGEGLSCALVSMVV